MPDDPTGPRSSRPADADLEAVPTPRRRISALRIPEDTVARPLTPPIVGRTVAIDDASTSERSRATGTLQVKTAPDAGEWGGASTGAEMGLVPLFVT